eukprot:symbB.v1.2.030900.t1/scaffold3528.1/size54678/6
MLQEEEPDPKIEGLKEVMELTKTGHIRLWKDRLGEGWIEPDEPIDDDSLHPSGWVWFYDREASESLTLKNVVNLPVKFMLYMQNFRLGAAFVTLLEEPKERREHSSPSPQRCQRAREEWREDEENCIKRRRIGDEDGEEVGEDEHEYPENGAFAWSPEEEDGEAQEEHRVKQEEESLQKAAPKQRPPPHLRPVSKPVSKPVRPVPGDGHENAKSLLQREVREVMKILGEQETLWSTSELAKRTVKYFDRGLNAAKDHDDWHVAAEKFMRSSLGSFSNACNSRSWFPDAEDFLKLGQQMRKDHGKPIDVVSNLAILPVTVTMPRSVHPICFKSWSRHATKRCWTKSTLIGRSEMPCGGLLAILAKRLRGRWSLL